MRIPKSLESLADHGVIQEVVRPLMSGKEAQIYMVVSDDHLCAAKIYKDAEHRSFKNRADYTEGRKVRNTRDQRAISKGSKYGKSKDEDSWKSTEVDMIYRLRDAGVRVPEPYVYIDGVLVMELVIDHEGNPAPRLGDLAFSPEEASQIYHHLISETARMLAAGVVHGDLSDFNVLLAADGPVVIDFPQAVNAAGNLNARTLLIRDVNNLHRFLERWVPGARRRPYAEEMWGLYENNKLTAETKLTGNFKRSSGPVDTSAVLSLIGDANRDEAHRRRAAGKSTEGLGDQPSPIPMRRREIVIEKPAPRGGPRSADSRGPQQGPGRDGPGRGGPAHGRPAHGGPGRGAPGRGAPGGGDGRRADGPRGRDVPRGGPPRRPDGKSGPKRGDAVQASTYVSPEARKSKIKLLTPRSESQQGVSPRGDTPRAQDDRPRQDKNGRRRPRRDNRRPEASDATGSPRRDTASPSPPRSSSTNGPSRPHASSPSGSQNNRPESETEGMRRRRRRPRNRSSG